MAKKFNSALRSKLLTNRPVLKREKIYFCGEEVWAFELTGLERGQVESQRYKVNGQTGSVTMDMAADRQRVVVLGLRDSGADDAVRVFDEGDAHELGGFPSSDLDLAYDAITRLSGMTRTAKADAEKNSDAGTGGSTSASLPSSGGDPSPGASPASAPPS